jgi:alcohol dehydrogenase class IV
MDMNVFAPRHMDIGSGASSRIVAMLARLGVTRPLIVTDPIMVSLGLIDRIIEPLDQAGIGYHVFSETVPEPVDTIIETGIRFAAGLDIDGIIAFGGGSPIDTAKAINILRGAGQGVPIRDFKVPYVADHAALPLIAIPTTAGTGSEATRFTVITDTATDEKMLIAGLGALPVAAIVDFELSMSVPPRTTADTGIDAFTHALEAFVSRRANLVSDGYARTALRLIGPHLRTVYREPDNRAAREAMMLGATMAGLAFSNASVALVHGMSRPIGAHFHVPHGMSNAMLLPAVTRYSLNAALPRYAEAARLAGFAPESDADQLAGARLLEQLDSINHDLGVPSPHAFGIGRDSWDERLPVMAAQALASGSPANNPRVPDTAAILDIYAQIHR